VVLVYGTCFVSPFWHIEFLGGCWTFGKFVHPCTKPFHHHTPSLCLRLLAGLPCVSHTRLANENKTKSRNNISQIKVDWCILHEINKRKANWIVHILRRNCLLQQVIEGNIIIIIIMFMKV